MNSFLEKLQKGMQADIDTPGDDEFAAQPPGETALPDGTAVFAAYKKKGIPTLKEKSDNAGRSKKIITAEDIEKTSATAQNDNEEKEINQEVPADGSKSSKIMSNKKNIFQSSNENSWFGNDGQLTVNVYQTENDLVLQSAIAGVKVEDLDVLIEDDVITIKGERANPLQEKGDYFIEECYWGPFSRKVILPAEVDSGRADAAMKDGILTIRIPKITHEKKKKLTIQKTA